MEKKFLPEELGQKNLEKLISHLESLRIAEYVELSQKPFRLIFMNFVAGIARGLGIALGATFVFAIMLVFLKKLIVLNIPLIGGFIAEILRIIEAQKGIY